MQDPKIGDWLDAGLTLGVLLSVGSLLLMLIFA